MHPEVKSINRRPPVGPYRPKHIFLEERVMEQAGEWKQEQAEREERLIAHYDRRKRRPIVKP